MPQAPFENVVAHCHKLIEWSVPKLRTTGFDRGSGVMG